MPRGLPNSSASPQRLSPQSTRTMSRDFLNLDEVAAWLGKDRRTVEKMVQRGVLPGRRIGGEWRFHPAEVTHWVEQDLRTLDAAELATLENSQKSTELDQQSPLKTLLHSETCEIQLDASTKPAALQALVEVAGRTWQIWDPAAVLNAVREREQVMSTGFENGVAIPHPRNPLPEVLGQSLIAFGRTSSGIPFGAPKRTLSDLFFLVLARDARTHLQILARLGRLLQSAEILDGLRSAPSGSDICQLLLDADAKIN
jgi:PTS system nitrogen regulatory IIA component